MIVAAQSKQFTLKEDGQIYFQPDSTNPLAGDVLASIHKGESLLQPVVKLIDGRDVGSETPADVLVAVETWMKAHIYTVLEPLFSLVSDETLAEPVKEIALKLFAQTGILPRGEVEDSISKLDADMRKILRDKKVRLGPLLIFLPDLNKPAAVKLRAILWSLFHDKPLPAPTPRDGAMSAVVDVATANPDFYRAIGYPLYGPRVIRIDMLDRVINAIYEKAKDSKFQAEHKMAEWMGCPIADLYAILTAMGHRQIVKPVEEIKTAEKVSETVIEEVIVVPEVKVEIVSETVTETATEIVIEVKKPEQKKPELDWFLLRRGKAHMVQAERPPRFQRQARPAQAENSQSETISSEKPRFPEERYPPKGQNKKYDNDKEGDNRSKFQKSKRDDKRDNGKDGKREYKKSDEKSANSNPRIYTAEASVSDNPFAVLQSLKLK